MAGGCKVQLIPVSLVTAVPLAVRGTISTAITTAVGATWDTYTPTLFTQAFNEAWTREEAMRVARAELGFVIPKDRALLLDGLWDLQRERFLVLHHDRNGTVKLMGTKSEPATVTMTVLKHGADPLGERNQYELRVTVARREECPFYLAAPPAVWVPGGVVCETLGELMAPEDGGDLWALMTAPQQAAALVAAGVLTFDGIIDDGPAYTESLIDP